VGGGGGRAWFPHGGGWTGMLEGKAQNTTERPRWEILDSSDEPKQGRVRNLNSEEEKS